MVLAQLSAASEQKPSISPAFDLKPKPDFSLPNFSFQLFISTSPFSLF